MPRIHAAYQLAFVEPERQPVIGLSRARLPCRLVTSHHRREPVQVGDDAAINGFVESEQTSLVREELAHGDRLLAVLRELGPVRRDPLVVIQPAARVGDREGHRRQALGGRVDDDHRVALPRVARHLVPNTAPEIDDFLAALVGAAGATQLAASSEVLLEHVAHGLKTATDVSFNSV